MNINLLLDKIIRGVTVQDRGRNEDLRIGGDFKDMMNEKVNRIILRWDEYMK